MFRLVVIILDHKNSLPSMLVNLVVWRNYFRWLMGVYLGWLVPYKKGGLECSVLGSGACVHFP